MAITSVPLLVIDQLVSPIRAALPTTIALPTSPTTVGLVRVMELFEITMGVPAAPTVVLFVFAGLLPWIVMALPLSQLLKVFPDTAPVVILALVALTAFAKTWIASPPGVVTA